MSKIGSALLDTTSETKLAGRGSSPAAVSSSTDALRIQVAERLAAHRSRRHTAPTASGRSPGLSATPSNSRSAKIAATVAERYARSPSYRAFLAAEAERAIQQARAAAEIAELNAQAVAAAQQSLLDAFDRDAREDVERPEYTRGLESEARDAACAEVPAGLRHELSPWPDAPVETHQEAPLFPRSAQESAKRADKAHTPSATLASKEAAPPSPGLTIRLYEEAALAATQSPPPRAASDATRRKPPEDRYDPEALALDDEIAFRQAPVFEEPAGPPLPLPANLIEFPRQLVASRKARPRYAEGPLREESADPPAAQLRIFEVDPAQISTTPGAVDTPASAQWAAIWLDAPNRMDAAVGETQREDEEVATAEGTTQEAAVALPERASMGRRTLASAIDAAVVATGLLVFAEVFLSTSTHSIPAVSRGPSHGTLSGLAALVARTGLHPGAIVAACPVAAGFLYLLYQALFFSFAGATLGMRCAHIALCTFDGRSPTRKAMRRRALAALLSAAPLGLGFFWATLSEDRLAWHDRLTRLYLRRY